MIEEDIHSCGYHCQIPACIKAQRDELVRKYVANWDKHYDAGWNSALEMAAHQMETEFWKAFGKDTLKSIAVFIKGLKKTI
jgi:hypothetical protein